MKILFEGYKYGSREVIKLLPEDYFDLSSDMPKPKVVGYHYSDEINCPIIILPKVFLNENDLFFIDNIRPEIFLESNYIDQIENLHIRNELANFLFESSSWFYFSIKKYFFKFKDNLSSFEDNLNIVDCSHNGNFHTELDLIFSLLKFNRENKDLFIFIKKINISQNSKVDWQRTIKKTLPVIGGNNVPIYHSTHTKQKQINVDEDLLVLFFSLLNDIQKRYNIRIPINQYYNLLPQREFDKIKKRGTFYLRSIRYKYFDDRLLSLYKILYAYFEKNEESKTKDKRKEYLIIKDYNLVFQDMVDELLTDKHIDSNLKKHKDDKELDHIYQSESFFPDDKIYFIGDSKYYKSGGQIENKSIYKQFTYAKNVIQYNIDLFHEHGIYPDNVRYRDELTEGYNITPNFFIRGVVEHLNHFTAELETNPGQNYARQINKHYHDRLFDRDTLIVQTYSINFLFVLWAYIKSAQTANSSFKTIAKKKFRNSLLDFFENRYDFWNVTVGLEPIEDFIKRNFYNLNGKIYRPANFNENNSFIVALDKNLSIRDFLANNTTGETTFEAFALS